MAFFWGAATVVLAAKTERLRVAETALLELALEKVRQLSDSVGSSSSSGESMKIPVVRTVDTRIPVSTVPFTNRTDNPRPIVGSTAACEGRLQEVGVDDDCYVIHGIEVTSTSKNDRSAGKDEKPLVLLHGYSKYCLYYLYTEGNGKVSILEVC